MDNRAHAIYEARVLQHQAWADILSAYDVNPNTARAWASKLHKRAACVRAEAAPASVPPERETVRGLIAFPLHVEHSTDTKREALERYLGTSKRFEDAPRLKLAEAWRKVISLGDLHGKPDPALTAAVIAERPTDIYFGGDILDQGQANPHQKGKPKKDAATFHDEVTNVRAMFELCEKELPDTSKYVFLGNHDAWVERKLGELLPDYLWQFFTDPIDILIANLPRFQRVQSYWQYRYPDGGITSFGETKFMYVVGNVLLSHFNFTGKFPGDGVRKLAEWVANWRQPLNLPDFSVLIQHHGHKISFNEVYGGHQIRVEPGMAGHPSTEDYKVAYQGSWTPGAIGAVVFEQYLSNGDWVTDLGSARLLRPRRSVMEKGA